MTDQEKLGLMKKFQLIETKGYNWAGHLKLDPTCFAYFFFRNEKGFHFKCREYQDMIINDTSKRLVVCIARQMGKSTMAAIKAFHEAYFGNNKTIVVVSSTKPQAMELIHRLKQLMRSAKYTDFKELLPSLKESRSEIVIKGNKEGTQSRIISVPATDAARGYTADLVIVDEAAFIENGDYIFNQVVEPMTQATDGDIILLSTPNGRQGFFYDCFMSEFWSSYQFDWTANPDNTKERMDIKKSTMTALAYQSEYEAKFTAPMAAYFITNEISRAISESAGKGAIAQRLISIGVDFGKIHDKCVINIGTIINPLDPPNKHIIRVIERIVKPLGTNYAQIIGEIKVLAKKLKPRIIVLDATGVGEGPSDILAQGGLPVEPVKFSIQSKVDIFSNLKILFEQGRIQIPENKELINQLEIFSYEYTTSGNMKLHAPEGQHDDECDALALMVWGLTSAISPPVTIKFI